MHILTTKIQCIAHTHTHTHWHTHARTRTHAHICTHVLTHVLTRIHTRTHTHADTHTYALTHSHAYTRTHRHTHQHSLTLIHTHTHTLTHSHTHTHTYTHTHTHTHTHTSCSLLISRWWWSNFIKCLHQGLSYVGPWLALCRWIRCCFFIIIFSRKKQLRFYVTVTVSKNKNWKCSFMNCWRRHITVLTLLPWISF